MSVRWSRRDPLAPRILRTVPSPGTLVRVHLHRAQEAVVEFTLNEGESAEDVAWELADGAWETVDRNVLSQIEIRDRK